MIERTIQFWHDRLDCRFAIGTHAAKRGRTFHVYQENGGGISFSPPAVVVMSERAIALLKKLEAS